jgi:hypothetical protein
VTTPEAEPALQRNAPGGASSRSADRRRPAATCTFTPARSGDVKAADDTHVDLHDGTLTVRTGAKWRSLTKSSVDLTIELPTGSSLQGSALGPLFAQGRMASCTFTSRSGDIRIDEAGRLDLRATAGSVVVGHAFGAAEIAVSAGGVRIRELDGDATIKNTNGTTEIGRTTGTCA